MTHAPGIPHGMRPPSLDAAEQASARRRTEAAQAARQFEGLLISEMLKVMRATVPDGGMFGGGDFGASMHQQMLDQQLAETMAERGIGIGESLERRLGGEPTRGTVHRPDLPALGRAFGGTPLVAGGGPAGSGVERLRRAFEEMTAEPDAALHWSRDGRLDREDLASDVAVPTEGGVARFSVQDVRGFQGYYKCNLFSLELARRAGFQVPVIGRERGLGYPAPNGITADAEDGRLRGDWARVVTGASATELQEALDRGDGAFLLSGSGAAGHRGHMAVVERVHEVHYGEDGALRRIVFDSWETRPNSGARHLVRRTWNVEGNPGGHMAREHFGRIEILALRRPEPGSPEEVILSRTLHASRRDAESASSPTGDHPNQPPRYEP